MEQIESSLTAQQVIGGLLKATGNAGFRFSSELSGSVGGDSFRVTLPACGFTNLYQAVVRGSVKSTQDGCSIEYRVVRPWLPSTLIGLFALVFVMDFWTQWKMIAITVGAVSSIALFGLSSRESDISKTTKILGQIASGKE